MRGRLWPLFLALLLAAFCGLGLTGAGIAFLIIPGPDSPPPWTGESLIGPATAVSRRGIPLGLPLAEAAGRGLYELTGGGDADHRVYGGSDGGFYTFQDGKLGRMMVFAMMDETTCSAIWAEARARLGKPSYTGPSHGPEDAELGITNDVDIWLGVGGSAQFSKDTTGTCWLAWTLDGYR